VIEIGDEHQLGVFIPCGVAHGFYAVTDVTLTYLVDNYYDGADEFGVAWNDPTLALAWDVEQPILSGRDQQNPRLGDIPVPHQPN
jgi:dTDP-4-dehydrorhamnose 3,5-epimerase